MDTKVNIVYYLNNYLYENPLDFLETALNDIVLRIKLSFLNHYLNY